jgi:serine/threonine-protein kinase RsbW
MNVVKRITLRIDSRLDCVSLVGVSINALCREHGLDEMASYQVQSATIEAVNNAILHAYDSQPGHSVDVDWLLQDDVVRIDIADRGKTMVRLPPDREPPPEAESGRGWWIMRRWMDHATYSSAGGLNRVSLYRRIKALDSN